MNQAQQAAQKISDANSRGGDLEAQVLAWDYVQRNSHPVEPGIDEFGDGSLLIERENLAFPDRQVLAEWLTNR